MKFSSLGVSSGILSLGVSDEAMEKKKKKSEGEEAGWSGGSHGWYFT